MREKDNNTTHFRSVKNQVLLCVIIFVVAFIPRIITAYNDERVPVSDAGLYDSYAIAWAENRGLQQWDMFIKHPLGSFTYRPPGYPLFLGMIYYVFGHSRVTARRIQTIFSALTCVFIFVIASKIFDVKVGLVSALIAAWYPPFIQLSTRLLTETLFMFLLYFFVLLALRMVERPEIKRMVLCGIILGLAVITRPVIIPLIPMLFVWLYFSKNFRKRYLVFSGVLLVSFLTILLPILVKNYQIHKKFILISTHDGVTFHDGLLHVPSLKNKEILLSKSEIRAMGLSETEERKFFYQISIGYLKKYPSEIPKIIQSKIKRLFFFFKGERKFRLFHFRVDRIGTNQHQNLWYCILVTSLFGILIFFKRKVKDIRRNNNLRLSESKEILHKSTLLFLIVISQVFTVSIFYAIFRYRYPFEPVFMMFSAYCLVHITHSIRQYWRRSGCSIELRGLGHAV